MDSIVNLVNNTNTTTTYFNNHYTYKDNKRGKIKIKNALIYHMIILKLN